MDRSIVFIFGIALLVSSTQGAELNSEATLSCNGKEFKCFNTTHYQPCSLTERSGQQPQYMINGNVLPCVAGKMCSDESATCCGTLTEIPVKVETAAKEDAPAEEMPVQSSPLKSLPVDEPVDVPVAAPAAPAAPNTETVAVAAPAEEQHVAEATKSAEPAAAPAAAPAPSANSSAPVDMLKTEDTKSKKKFNFKGLKKVGPIRLVKGFRAATWRPKISLDSQKDIADNLRKRIYERRNKYEKFVDVVLGKATPFNQSAKQPAPGQPASDPVSDLTTTEPEFQYEEDEKGEDIATTTTTLQVDTDDQTDAANSDDESETTTIQPDGNDDDEDQDDDDTYIDKPHKKPQNINENYAIVETNPVNNIHIGAPQVVIQHVVQPVPVSACSECDCGCEVIIEKPCETPCYTPQCTPCEHPCSTCDPCDTCHRPPCSQCESPCSSCENPCKKCNKPCSCERPPCQQCERPCCEKPPCHECTQTVAVLTTVEVVENCPAYEEVIYNDEPYLIETNHTITSTYNITQDELAQQQLEAEQFQHDQELARKPFCGGGGLLHGIKHDEEQTVINVNGSLMIPVAQGANNQSKGHIIAGIANNHNKQPTKPCQITSGWACRRVGRFPHPSHCQKYIQCHFCGHNTVYECPYDQAFDGRQCSADWSTCPQIHGCRFDRELLADPWNKSNYFICVRKKGLLRKFFVFRRFCPEDHEFDPARQQCYRVETVVVIKPVVVKPTCCSTCTYGC